MKKNIHILLLSILSFQSSLVAVQDSEKDQAVPPKDKCYLTLMPLDILSAIESKLSLKEETALVVALLSDKSRRENAQKRLDEIKDVLMEIDNRLKKELKKLKAERYSNFLGCPVANFCTLLQIHLHLPLAVSCRTMLMNKLNKNRADYDEKLAQKIKISSYRELDWVDDYIRVRLIKSYLKNHYSDPCNCCGKSVLMYLVEDGHQKSVELLLNDANVDPNVKRKGTAVGTFLGELTPLNAAVKHSDAKMVKTLLKRGADFNQSDLDVALKSGNEEIVNLLREAYAQAAPEIEKAWMWKKYMLGTGIIALGGVCAVGRYLYKKWKAKKEAREKANNQILPTVRVA